MIVADEQAMVELGLSLADQLKIGDIVAIDGPLGAGKTVLCRGILAGLGYSGEVSSPSYAFVNSYGKADTTIPVIHADLYRVASEADIEELGLFDDSENCLTLIEWASLSEFCMKRASQVIAIEHVGGVQRRVTITKPL